MLRTRVFFSLLPFVVILLAMGIYAVTLFSRLAQSVDQAVTSNYRSIVAVQGMSDALAGMEGELRIAVATRSTNAAAFLGYQQEFQENMAQQMAGAQLPGEADLNTELTAAFEGLLRHRDVFTPAAAPTAPLRAPRDQSLPQTQGTTLPFLADVERIGTVLESLRTLHYESALATSQRIRKTTHDVNQLMLAGMGIVLAVSILTCYLLSRSILNPIQSLTRATRELGEGKWDQPVPVRSRDELGELAVAFNRMAAQLQEYRENTSEEIVRLHRTTETTLASFPDPIFVLSREGGIELRNPAAADFASALHLNGHLPERLQVIARKALESGENFLPHTFSDVISYRIQGSEKFFLPRILAMRNKDNELFGVAVVLYDVTRFRLLDAAKTNLVATVSHELNTPLTSIRMALHILLEKAVGTLTPKQDELLQTARSDTERLLRILNDLLDLARLEEGNDELRKEKMFPVELLQSVIDEMADKVTARGLTMTCTVEPELPAVSVDRQRISHVFTNLITNAIKYSPAGGVISLRADRAEDNSVEFSVADQGAGIPEEYQPRIFDRFFRVPGQNKTGAGLGLSIAREIAVAHGGRIGVHSQPGQGTTFFVVLKAAS